MAKGFLGIYTYLPLGYKETRRVSVLKFSSKSSYTWKRAIFQIDLG